MSVPHTEDISVTTTLPLPQHDQTGHTCVTDVTVTNTESEDKVNVDAFFYIVVVLTFYATSIVLLLIKYSRNDYEEVNLKYQYSEFVKRERFQTAQYKNMIALQRTKAVLDNLAKSTERCVSVACPVIIVSEVDETQHCFHGNHHTTTFEDIKKSSIYTGSSLDQYGLSKSESLYKLDNKDVKCAQDFSGSGRKRCWSI